MNRFGRLLIIGGAAAGAVSAAVLTGLWLLLRGLEDVEL